MKFVYFGYDVMLPAIQRLISEGHELSAIFTFECDNVFSFNQDTRALAEAQRIPLYLDKPAPEQLKLLEDEGAEVFLAAGYPFKIPPIDENRAYALNLHPALLPKGRGIMPTPYIIKECPEAAGITLHKMTQEFDKGDILIQKPLPLSPQETVEIYSARASITAPEMISMVFADLPHYWENATPQDEDQSIHFPVPTDEMRTLDFSQSIEEIEKTGRAFGKFGSIGRFEGKTWVIFNFDCWKEEHQYGFGKVILKSPTNIILTCANGFISLTNFQPLA